MADILAFPTPERKSRSSRAAKGRPAAEIVIFPGVRYERWVETDEAAEAATQAAEAPHDRLMLAD